jgi:hypothetical protein
MLFLLNDGVPSIAKWVLLDDAAADVPAVPPDPPQPTEPDPDPEPGPDPDPDPTTDPGPDVVPDLVGPTLRLGFAEDKWLKQLRHTGKLRVHVTVDEPATVDLQLLRRGHRVARAGAEIGTDPHPFALHPRHRTLKWLQHARAPRLRFSVVAVDAAENDTAWARLLRR